MISAIRKDKLIKPIPRKHLIFEGETFAGR